MDSQAILNEQYQTALDVRRPSVLYRPHISADGTMWCALLGENLQEGVSGFGDTPDAAMRAFDVAFNSGRTPTAVRLAKAGGPYPGCRTPEQCNATGRCPRDPVCFN